MCVCVCVCLCVYLCVYTGSGKSYTLEGSRSRDAGGASPQGDGAVHYAADELFKLLHQRAVAVGK